MMTDPITWSPISLGRWGGSQVRIHFTLILLVVGSSLQVLVAEPSRLGHRVCVLGLLVLALAVHELGHALMAYWLGAEPEDVRLSPLGNMVGPTPVSQPSEAMLIGLAGPIVSLSMVLLCSLILTAWGAQFVWNPFGNNGSGVPTILGTRDHPQHDASALSAIWFLGWFGYLSWLIALINMIPALPFDNGRVLPAFLAQTSVTLTKDGMFAPSLARVFAFLLVSVGLLRIVLPPFHIWDGLAMIVIAGVIEWMVRTESRMIEDGGFFDDGVFGYDFSEGYTSLEANTAKVRPYRESAIKRWRRRRSELRRQRRQAREVAEERRMDEILVKLHREGRSALSEEEHRFLVRVSAKYRNNKPRTID